MLTNCAYYFKNHAMVVVPPYTDGDKLRNVRHYIAKYGRQKCRDCKASLWELDHGTRTVCPKQPYP